MILGKLVGLLGLTLVAVSVNAAQPLKLKDISPEAKRQRLAHQISVNSRTVPFSLRPNGQVPERPVSEVEEAGYMFMSSDTPFDSAEVKKLLAQHLPKDVTLVIYTSPGANKDSILNTYAGLIEPERLKVVEIPNTGRGFWARDGLPVPVWSKAGTMDLVDARYYHSFEPDKYFEQWFNSYLYKHDYYFEGGNFMANDRGDCIVVNTDETAMIPESIFTDMYGCKRTIRMPFEKGIGHIDETVRFIKSNTLVSDSPTYSEILRGHGFEVLDLPRPDREFETYVNAMLVNNTIWVPIYEQEKDDEVIEIYRSAGLNVIPVETLELSNDGLGSIHCIVFAYPKVPFQALLKQLGAREL